MCFIMFLYARKIVKKMHQFTDLAVWEMVFGRSQKIISLYLYKLVYQFDKSK